MDCSSTKSTFLPGILEVEVIVEIILHLVFLEINDQIDVAFVIESVGQYRPEHEKSVYLVPLAQGNYVLDMVVYQFHLSANIKHLSGFGIGIFNRQVSPTEFPPYLESLYLLYR